MPTIFNELRRNYGAASAEQKLHILRRELLRPIVTVETSAQLLQSASDSICECLSENISADEFRNTVKWLTEGDLTRAYTRVDARLARRWKWQGREVEAALVGQNLGDDYEEFRDTNIFSSRVYGSLAFAW